MQFHTKFINCHSSVSCLLYHDLPITSVLKFIHSLVTAVGYKALFEGYFISLVIFSVGNCSAKNYFFLLCMKFKKPRNSTKREDKTDYFWALNWFKCWKLIVHFLTCISVWGYIFAVTNVVFDVTDWADAYSLYRNSAVLVMLFSEKHPFSFCAVSMSMKLENEDYSRINNTSRSVSNKLLASSGSVPTLFCSLDEPFIPR